MKITDKRKVKVPYAPDSSEARWLPASAPIGLRSLNRRIYAGATAPPFGTFAYRRTSYIPKTLSEIRLMR